MTANAQTAATPAAGKYYHIKVGSNYIDNAVPVFKNTRYDDCFHLGGAAASAAVFKLEAVENAGNTLFYIDYVGNGSRPSGRVLYTGNNGAGTVVLGRPSATQDNNTWEIASKGDGYTIISGGTAKGGFNKWENNPDGLLALWSDTGGATVCTFEEVDAETVVKQVTYRYSDYDGLSFGSYTVDQLKDSSPCAFAPHEYLTQLRYDKETVTTDNEEISVSYDAPVYPFVATTIVNGGFADDTRWYTMNVNQWSDKNIYTGEGDAVMVNGTRDLDASHLWCFERVAGSLDLFRIYNLEKGAGAPLTLVKNASYNEYNQATASTGAGEETTQFRIVPNGAGYCIQHPDQPQANIGNHVGNFFAVWQGAGSPTHDKSRIFFQSADDLVDRVLKIKASEYVGGYSNVPAQLTEKINAYKSTRNVENLKILITANKDAVDGGMQRRMLETGKYYELLTYTRVKGARLYLNPATAAGTVTENLDAKASRDCSALSSLWQFVPADGGGYKVTHVNTGKALGTGRASGSQTLMDVPADNNSAGTYTLKEHDQECDVWGVLCSNNRYLNMNNYNGETVYMYGFGPSSDDGSPWQIREVSEIEVALNAVDGESVATLHLPFNATVKETGTTVNVGTFSDDKSMMTLTPVAGVPANTGVVLHNSAAASSVTLAIGGEVEAAASDLSGTNVSISLTDDNRADYLIFGLSDGELGFYRPSASVTQLGANKAWLPAAGLNAVRLMLGGDPTGIGHAAVTDPMADAPLYDLSGRRVKDVVKGGIYLRNGKKFIVK